MNPKESLLNLIQNELTVREVLRLHKDKKLLGKYMNSLIGQLMLERLAQVGKDNEYIFAIDILGKIEAHIDMLNDQIIEHHERKKEEAIMAKEERDE